MSRADTASSPRALHPDVLSARILIVDDVEDNRNILNRRLRRFGFHNLAEVVDGMAALDHLRDHAADLVLLDVMMPRMNGLEVLRTLAADGRLQTTPVIMISAASEIDTVVHCIELGAEDYLPKPFNAAILRARIGSVLEKKRLEAEVRRQLARLEQEMAVARRQQLAMVPTSFPPPGSTIDLHAVMLPALEVGGDLYDFFEIGAHTACVAIGDVSGKGMPAALFMARARSMLRAGTLQHVAVTGRLPLPSEIAALLNEELCKNNEDSLFLTLIIGLLDMESGRLIFANAGHLWPLHMRPGGVHEVECPADPPIGVHSGLAFHDTELQLDLEDTLVLITDGMTEMENSAMDMYSVAHVVRDLDGMLGHPAHLVAHHLVSRVFDHAAEAPQFDDVTLMVLRRIR